MHKNGCEYFVLCVTNLDNPRDDHPPDVVYYSKDNHGRVFTAHGRTNSRMWSRPLSTWHASMTLIKTLRPMKVPRD